MVFFDNIRFDKSKCSSTIEKIMEIDESIIERVWEKGTIVEGVDPAMFRKDFAGAMILRSAYGRRDIPMGWEIDHLKPKSKGGIDELNNLIPIQWENNVIKSDNYPIWHSSVTFRNNSNSYEKNIWLAIETSNGIKLLRSKFY